MRPVSVSFVPFSARRESRLRHSEGVHRCPAYRRAVDGAAVGVVWRRAIPPRHSLPGGRSVRWCVFTVRRASGVLHGHMFIPISFTTVPVALATRGRVASNRHVSLSDVYIYYIILIHLGCSNTKVTFKSTPLLHVLGRHNRAT